MISIIGSLIRATDCQENADWLVLIRTLLLIRGSFPATQIRHSIRVIRVVLGGSHTDDAYLLDVDNKLSTASHTDAILNNKTLNPVQTSVEGTLLTYKTAFYKYTFTNLSVIELTTKTICYLGFISSIYNLPVNPIGT
jgi:hypothetical protein